ncbi:MAG: ASCH domain-containing protein [Austwickia sp.]|nr:ASCH domain-containing protein [Austwickia sp.]MCO5310693.1 ASCH domain-containing protein [Austwickia sp.]
MTQDEIDAFWEDARIHVGLTELESYVGNRPLASVQPPAWAFGATPQQADQLLALVLAGTKTGTASALWDYEADAEPLPTAGMLSIILDGGGHPKALVRTDDVQIVPFAQVSEEHAYAEGEADRTLASWRDIHRRFFTEHATHDRGFAEDMPVVLERFSVLHTWL